MNNKMSYELEFDGIEVKLGKKIYVAAELNFFSLKKLAPKIATLVDMTFEDRIDVMLQTIHASLIRNHPEVTLEEVQRTISFSNAEPIFKMILETSGMGEKTQEEDIKEEEGTEEKK